MIKRSNIYSVRDIYSESKLRTSIEYKLYKKVWDTFSGVLVNYLIETGEEFKLPHYLGTFQIRKKRPLKTRKRVDFKKTREYGMTIYHTNRHTDGFYGMWYWSKSKPMCVCRNKQHFKFELVRKNKRLISKHIKENNSIINYLELN